MPSGSLVWLVLYASLALCPLRRPVSGASAGMGVENRVPGCPRGVPSIVKKRNTVGDLGQARGLKAP